MLLLIMIKFMLVVLLISYINLVICDSKVAMKFESKSIVPDVINEPPQNFLYVVYNRTVGANLGNSIKTKLLQNVPMLFLDPLIKLENSSFYTALMVNADAPTRRNSNLRNVLHWMIANFRDDTTPGELKVEYLPLNPPKGSGHHRIVVLLYKHPKITFNETIIDKNSTEAMRYKFSVKDFEKKYKLGAPIAGNFFRCSFHYN